MSVDPFEITQQGSSSAAQPSSASPSSRSSLASMVVGWVLQAGALSLIGYGWLHDKIPVAWHALLAIVAVMLPTDSLTSLARGAIKAWASRSK